MIREIIEKNFTPPIISEKAPIGENCFVCGSPLNKGQWNKHIDLALAQIKEKLIGEIEKEEPILSVLYGELLKKSQVQQVITDLCQ